MTLEEFKAKWITDYIPTQADYAELFDFITSQNTNKKSTVSFELGDFSTEGSSPSVPETIVDIVETPGDDLANILQKVYIAAKLTAPYQLTSNSTPNAIDVEVYQGNARIGVVQLDMTTLAFSPALFEVDFDYGGQIANFVNQPISIEIVGSGTTALDPNTAKFELKYTAVYTTVDAFNFEISGSGEGGGMILGPIGGSGEAV